MKMEWNRIYTVMYRLFYTVVFLLIAVAGFGGYFGISQIKPGSIFFMCLILGALMAVGYCRLRGKFAAGIFLLMLFVMLPKLIGEDGDSHFWTGYGKWLMQRDGWQEEQLMGYEMVQCSLVVLGCYLLQIATDKVLYLKEILAVSMAMGLGVFMVSGKPVSQVAVSFVFCYMILCVIELTRRYWPKKKEEEHRRFMVRILPFCILYSVLLCMMPAPEKAYDWQIVKDVYYRMQEKFTVWIEELQKGDKEDFGMAQMGFSEDGKLMGGIGDNNELLMSLQGSQGLRTNVYLIGKVYDEFDGRAWEQTVTEDRNERMLDTLETLYAVYSYDREFAEDYIYSTGLSVRYEHFNTGYVFAPLKTRYLEGCEIMESGSNLLFGEKRGYGTEYKTVYWQLNIDHDGFYEMVEAKLPIDEVTWNEIVREYVPKESKEFTVEDLQNYRLRMTQNYGEDVDLSKEVRAYLDQITEGKATQIEKLRAIEKELAGYIYTNKPGKLPEDIDNSGAFLDYFLLDSKEGYCAYFASAFVMLARAEGIPARYVEGFCVPVTASRYMSVTAGMTHAWPEVYIDGVGWIPFEPTPGYARIRYTPWKLQSEQEKKDGEPRQYIEPIEEEVKEDIKEDIIEPAKEQSDAGKRMLKVAAWIVLVVMAGCLFFVLAERLLFAGKYRRMCGEEKFKIQIKRLEMLLKCLGYHRAEAETISELRSRAVTGIPDVELNALICYEEYLYNEVAIEEEVLALVSGENRLLMERLKQENRWYYYYICFRYGMQKGEKKNGKETGISSL